MPDPQIALKELRCTCGKKLAEYGGDNLILQIKCPKCQKINKIESKIA